MPRPSFAAERRPGGSTCPTVARGTLTPADRTRQGPFRLVRGPAGPSELPRTAFALQVSLFTEGGLELPLKASPVQAARLLESVVKMASGDDRDERPLDSNCADPRVPHLVRRDQVLSRVRVVVRPIAITEGEAS